MGSNSGMKSFPTCPNCSQTFNVKDPHHPHGPRMPVLLDCCHVFCEGCLRHAARFKKAIHCTVCQKLTDLPDGEHSIKNFPNDIYILGLLASNRCSLPSPDSFKLTLVPPNKFQDSLVKNKTDVAEELCEECSKTSAVVKCDRCDCCYCNPCFARIHKTSKSLQKHKAVILKEKVAPGFGDTLCHTHNRSIEFYCQDDNSPACSHCVALGDHKGHNIMSLEERNELSIPRLKTAIEDAATTVKVLTDSYQKILALIPKMKTKATNLSHAVRSRFSTLHSILQKRETDLLRKLEDATLLELNPYEEMKETVNSQIKFLNSIIADGKKLAGNPQFLGDAFELTQKLERAKYLPCYFLPNDENDSLSLENSTRFTFEEEFESQLLTHGDIYFCPNVRYVLKSSKDVSPDQLYPIESLKILEDLKTKEMGSTGLPSRSWADMMEELSNETGSETSSSHSHVMEEFPKIQILPKRTGVFVLREKVFVTHIKHPCHFVVQRCSDTEQLQNLSRNMNKWCRSCDANLAIPSQPLEGVIYLGQFHADGQWYRTRVNKIIPNEDENSLDIKVDVTYIDYGNGEILPSHKLREMPRKFLKLPEMALLCSLDGIAPKHKADYWSEDAVREFARMIGDKTVLMTVIRQEANMLYVDLFQPPFEDIDDLPLSIRDALVFLEVGSFISPSSVTMPGVSVSPRKYLRQDPLQKDEKFKVNITFISNPEDFYIQRTGECSKYLLNMMVAMQNTYDSDKSNLWTVFAPYKGMVCACLYSADRKWYRAKVLSLPGNRMVEISYIDFGNSEQISHLNLRVLLDDFMKIPPQAFHCGLADIEPLSKDCWSVEAKAGFIQLVFDKSLLAIVPDTNEDMSKLILFDTVDSSSSVNAQLVQLGFAKSTGSGSKDIQVFSLEESYSNKGIMVKENTLNKFKHPVLETEKPITPVPKPICKKISCLRKAPGAPVRVSHFETPACFYIQIIPPEVDGLDRLMKTLRCSYEFTDCSQPGWKEGDLCVARYSQDHCWYRVKILKLLEESKVQINMLDYGYKDVVDVEELRPLLKEYQMDPAYAMLCHLADIIPAGDHWSQIACEYMASLIKECDHFHIVKKAENMINGSLPADLLHEQLIPGGALEGSRVELISLSEQLVEDGLALPKRSVIENSSKLHTEETTDNKTVLETTEYFNTDRDVCSDHELDDSYPEMTSTINRDLLKEETVDDNIKNNVLERPENIYDEHNASFQLEPDAPFDTASTMNRESKKEMAKKVVPSPSPTKEIAVSSKSKSKKHLPKYLPPDFPESKFFLAIPTHVSEECLISLQDVSTEKSLTHLMEVLQLELNNSEPEENSEWQVGELCSVRYHIDKLWYRGIITCINGKEIEVLYIDFGNSEIVQSDRLRKKIILPHVPKQCLTCKLYNLQPLSSNGIWPIEVIQLISQTIITGQKCHIEIVDQSKISQIRIISPDGIDLAKVLITHEVCVPVEEEEETETLDCLYSFPEPILPNPGIPFPVAVTQMFTPNLLCIQRKHYFEPNNVFEQDVNQELDTFLQNCDTISTCIYFWSQLKNPLVGNSCCAQYINDGSWNRGCIANIEEDSADVLFVDFGNTEKVNLDCLRVLPREYSDVPKQAVKCQIANLVPVDDTWSDSTLDIMTELLTGVSLWAVVKKSNPMLEIELYDKNPTTDPDSELIYQPLIDQGFALLDQ